jgi:hypothetical protein
MIGAQAGPAHNLGTEAVVSAGDAEARAASVHPARARGSLHADPAAPAAAY